MARGGDSVGGRVLIGGNGVGGEEIIGGGEDGVGGRWCGGR